MKYSRCEGHILCSNRDSTVSGSNSANLFGKRRICKKKFAHIGIPYIMHTYIKKIMCAQLGLG